VRLVLLASVLNLVLPSKMGDIAKAAFVADEKLMPGQEALALVMFEKMLDMASLLMWCAFGLIILADDGWVFWSLFTIIVSGLAFLIALFLLPIVMKKICLVFQKCLPQKISGKIASFEAAWAEMRAVTWATPSKLAVSVLVSIGLWALHLVQIWCFALAIGTGLGIAPAFGLAPLAILVGLMPFTFAGIGSRDAALVYFLAPYMAETAALVLGFLCTMRYVMPAIGGIPFLAMRVNAMKQTKFTLGAKET